MDAKPHTLEEDFEHFLSYSNIRIKLSSMSAPKADLLKAYEACWTPLQEARAKLKAAESILNDPRVRALFPPLPDGAVLGSCSGDVFEVPTDAASSDARAEANTTSGEPRDIPRAPANTRDPSS